MGAKKALLPRLRFPEFQDAGEWDVGKLADRHISSFVKEKMSLDQLAVKTYVSTENLLPDYRGVTTASSLPSAGSFTRYRKADILISNIRPYLKKVWLSDRNGGSSNDVVVVRANSELISSFLALRLKSDEFIAYIMRGAKGVKMPRGDISLMKEFPLAYPPKEEQQEIASCLSSLDELISAQSQKLDAFIVHRKGLIQQMFPQEGESVPRLRFPEFLDAGEWKEKRLDRVCEVNPKGESLPDEFVYIDLESVEAGSLLQKNIVSRSEAPSRAQRLLENGDIIFQLVRPYQKNNYLFDESDRTSYVASTGYAQLRAKQSSAYLYQYVHTESFVAKVLSQCEGSNYPAIASGELSKILVRVPEPDEQQRIASCLSSLDELISAQSRRLDALKIHKKGLMQQLFPATEEPQ